MSRLDRLIHTAPEDDYEFGFWPWDLFYKYRKIVGAERIEEIILILEPVRLEKTTCLVFQR